MARHENKFTLFPLIKYKDWTFFPTPDVVAEPEECFRMLKEYNCRDSDVLLCTAAKAGTHWVHEIMSMLLSQTTEYNTQGMFLPMLLEFMRGSEEIKTKTGTRLFYTHLPFSYLPNQMIQNRNKIVYVNRNPKDRHVSMYHWLQGKNGVPAMTWAEYFNDYVLKDTLYTGWFNHTKEMSEAIQNNKANIFPIFYEDLHMNTKRCVVDLAKFLDVIFTNGFINEIISKCSFEGLKENKVDASTGIEPEGKKTIFRKGVIGDWNNWFTVAQNEQFEALYEQEMAGVNIEFTYNPPDW